MVLGGGGVWNFLFANQRIVFLPLPLSNSHCFRHPVRSQRGKVQKVAKNMRWKCSLASCIAGYACPCVGAWPHHLPWVRYRVLINAILLRWPLFRVDVSMEGGGGGYRILQQSRGEAKLQYFSGVPWTKRKRLVLFSGRWTPFRRF